LVTNVHAGENWHIEDLVQIKRDSDGVVRVYNVDLLEFTTAGDEAAFEGHELFLGDLIKRIEERQ
jgi:hypothetical protein